MFKLCAVLKPLGMFCFTQKKIIVIDLVVLYNEIMFAFAIVDNEIDEFNTSISSSFPTRVANK